MMDIADRDFDKGVLKCKLPVFACFTTRWCHTCFPMCLFADELAQKYDARVKFVKVDIEKSPEIGERYHVIAVPTILIFKDSQLVKKLLGFQDRRLLRHVLDMMVAGKDDRHDGGLLEIGQTPRARTSYKND